jgi:hypothetical protein
MKNKLQTKIIIIFLLYFITCNLLFAEKERKLDLDSTISFGGNNEIANIDYYFLRADLEIILKVLKKFECTLGLELDRFEVEVEEISFDLTLIPYFCIKLGKFENALTLDEYMPGYKRIFGKKNRISDYVDSLGYVNSNFSLKFYKKYQKDTLPVSYFFQGTFNASSIEPQFDIGFFFHYDKKDSYLGILVSYYPFLTHDIWEGENKVSRKHNFLIDIACASYERRIVYGLELTCGSNLIDPIGIIHTPGTGNRTFFLGGDTFIGCKFFSKKKDIFQWLPALRFSILFPELTVMESQQIEIVLGNLFRFFKKIYLHIDFGIGINTQYKNDDLYTKLEFLWAVNFTVKI